MRIPKKVGNGALGILSKSDVYHGSSDASLFSSSLPVGNGLNLNLKCGGMILVLFWKLIFVNF